MGSPLHFVTRTVKARPRLFVAFGLALAIGWLLPVELAAHVSTRFLIAWNLGVCIYLGLVTHMALNSTPERVHRRALVQAESRYVTIALVILAVVAAFMAIVIQLGLVKEAHGALKLAHIGLAAFTIVSAWTFTHTMFALHYAHDFYYAAAHHQPPGLVFPETTDPEYGDFLYCAFIVGTSGQTADVSFSSKPMRRLGMVHSVLSFFFNTTLLALTINIAASFL